MAGKNIVNKEITQRSNPGYLIFFDDIRVDDLVPSYSVHLSCSGSYGSAQISMTYCPDLDKISHNFNESHLIKHQIDNVNSDNTSKTFYIEDGVENMTNVRIFVKSPFSGRYSQIFEGNIRGKRFSMHKTGRTLTFQAYDYMNWMNRIICPWATAMNDSIFSVDLMCWAAYGIDTQYAANNFLNSNQQELKGKSISEAINTVLQYSYLNNKFLQEEDSVLAWDKPLLRLMLMGDIAEELRNESFWGYVVSTQISNTDTFYLKMQQILQNLLFEYFQDRDGLIRIKPPFWNRDVLENHIIDSTLIEDYYDDVNWNNFYTRIICKGGSDQVYNVNQLLAEKITTPAAIVTFSGEVVSQRTLIDKNFTDEAMTSPSSTSGSVSGTNTSTGSGTAGNLTDSEVQLKVKTTSFLNWNSATGIAKDQLQNAVEKYMKEIASKATKDQVKAAKDGVGLYYDSCKSYKYNPIYLVAKDMALTQLGISAVSKNNWGNLGSRDYDSLQDYLDSMLSGLNNTIDGKSSFSMQNWADSGYGPFEGADVDYTLTPTLYLSAFAAAVDLLLRRVDYKPGQTNASLLGISTSTKTKAAAPRTTVAQAAAAGASAAYSSVGLKDPNVGVVKKNAKFNKSCTAYNTNDGTGNKISVVTPGAVPGNQICLPFGKNSFTYFSIFGKRSSGWHQGADLIPKSGDHTIYAVMGGTVLNATFQTSMGYYVRIRQWDGYTTRYMHMQKGSFKVHAGEEVKTGQALGIMGRTGCNVTGEHLHIDFTWPGTTSIASKSITSAKHMASHFASPISYMGLISQCKNGKFPKKMETFKGSTNVKVIGSGSSTAGYGDESAENAALGLATSSGQPGITYTRDSEGNLIYTLDTGEVTMSFKDNQTASTEFLLQLGELEKRYGPLIHSITQSMIKFENGGTGESYVNNATDSNETISAADSNKAYDTLIEYGKFMLNYLNANSNTATVSTICMPWLRPGTNVWVDPEGLDKIYYLTDVTHTGSMENGCHSQLQLSIGRLRQNFLDKTSLFGYRADETQDVFINKVYYDISTYGKTVKDYDAVKTKIKAYHQTSGASVGNLYNVQNIGSSENPLQQYYANDDDKVKRYRTQMKVTDMRTGEAGHSVNVDEKFLVFDGEYTENQIQEALSEYYEDAPDVVKKRRNRLEKIITNSRKRLGYMLIQE